MTTPPTRRTFLGAALAGASLPAVHTQEPRTAAKGRPTMVGSANALPGMLEQWERFSGGGDPLDHAIEVVKFQERNEKDSSVGLGGLPGENGIVTLDAAVMHGPTHNSGAVAAIENILHPSEVARLVMERTDHCLIVGRGAYEFARMHGHDHVELLTEKARKAWVAWRERMSTDDDRLPARKKKKDERGGLIYEVDGEKLALEELFGPKRPTGTIHCSALGANGHVACTTTTSGLSWKIPGRVGDSPIIGAGLYCDQEAGSAGATGRGESAILSNGSFAIVELLRKGASPLDAGMEVLGRIARQARRGAKWQPALVDDDGRPAFGVKFYILGLDGQTAGVTLKGKGNYSVATPENGPERKPLTALFPK
ncbi:MAG: asparaginase [bacterium]|nr:asparaginase [bacterium]